MTRSGIGRASVAALWAGAALAAAGARAEAPEAALVGARIDATNFVSLSPGGVDATGGIGDWAISNGVLCAVVSDPAHESDLAVSGGALVDLGHCGRGDDQLVLLQPLANLSRSGAFPVERVTVQGGGDAAQIVAEGARGGLEVVTVWSLDLHEPERLRITSRVTRQGPGERLFAFGDIALHTEHAVRPFALDTRPSGISRGFAHPAVDVGSALSVARAVGAADTVLLIGADAIEPGIAYAVRVKSARLEGPGRESLALPTLSISGVNFSGFAAFSSPFWRDPALALGPLEMMQTLFMDLEMGDTLVFEREVLVSSRADAASLTDRIFEDARAVKGRVGDVGARLHIHDATGRVTTEVRPEPDGRFALRLPAGEYRLDVLGSAGGETQRAFSVGDSEVDLGEVSATPLGRVVLPRGQAMRLVFLGRDGTPDPRFGDERPAVTFGEKQPPSSMLTRDVSLAGVATDPEWVPVRPGRYFVLATRGPLFSVTRAELDVPAGESVALVIAPPERVLATPGWISADLHVHAAPSDDSALPLDRRLASYVADGCDVIVATDHDMVTDYGPVIHELGLAGRIASVTGQEVTSNVPTPAAPYTFGHANLFPLALRPQEYRGGALPNEGRRLREVIAAARSLGGTRIVQLNHPLSEHLVLHHQAFFSHLSTAGEPFDPKSRLEAWPNSLLLERDPATGVRDLDFDAIELLNGSHMPRYRAVREDWFALLRQGVVRTGTANSDSHLLREIAAAPRNLIRVGSPEASPGGGVSLDEEAFVRAIRAGRVIGTTGPLLRVAIGDAGPGERFVGREGWIQVEVQAAPWVPVSRVRVYVNGVVAHEAPLERGSLIGFPHQFDGDAFVTVEVEGEPDETYAALLPEFTPFAFSNPIFVDADGDGVWAAPEASP